MALQKWNKRIYDAGHGELNRMSQLMGVEQAMSSDKDGDQEDRIWAACLSLRSTITRGYIDIVPAEGLDQIALCYNMERRAGEFDKPFRIRLHAAKDRFDRGEVPETNGVADRPVNWVEGAHFVRKRPSGTEPEIYRVMHPGQAGGDVAFVYRIDTKEQLLFDRHSTDIREVTDPDELAERVQEAGFAALMRSFADGDINLAVTMEAARNMLLGGKDKALCDVLAERQAQIGECRHDLYDDAVNKDGELQCAAAAYLLTDVQYKADSFYPWSNHGVLKKDKRTRLVRGTALALAALEQHDRRTKS